MGLSQASVGRLSLYYRELHRLLDSETENVNSQGLGKIVNVSPAVVRRDLSSLGTIGRRGVGYDVRTLIDRIGAVLGTGRNWKAVLIGAGSLGDALLRYRGFERLGFELIAAFDNSPQKIGKTISGTPIIDIAQLDQLLGKQHPELSILAVPAEQADQIASQLVAGGVSGILNFAPVTLKLPPRIAVVNVDLASELQRLAFQIQVQRPQN